MILDVVDSRTVLLVVTDRSTCCWTAWTVILAVSHNLVVETNVTHNLVSLKEKQMAELWDNKIRQEANHCMFLLDIVAYSLVVECYLSLKNPLDYQEGD